MAEKLDMWSVILVCAAAIGLAMALSSVADFDLDTAVGIWHMDEGEGDTTMDSSDSGDHGKLWRDPVWVDGRFGKALQFDGQSFVWMKPANGVPEGTMPRTLMAHFKWAEINDFAGAINQVTDAEVLLAIGTHNWGQPVNLQISAEAGPGGGLGIDIFDDRLMYEWEADTEWHHLAAVFPDGSDRPEHFLIYFDGMLQEETVHVEGQDNNPQGLNTVGGEVAIGCWTGGPTNFFRGIIDDDAVFPFPMAAEDVSSVAKRGLVRGQVLDVSPQTKLATSWGALEARE